MRAFILAACVVILFQLVECKTLLRSILIQAELTNALLERIPRQ